MTEIEHLASVQAFVIGLDDIAMLTDVVDSMDHYQLETLQLAINARLEREVYEIRTN